MHVYPGSTEVLRGVAVVEVRAPRRIWVSVELGRESHEDPLASNLVADGGDVAVKLAGGDVSQREGIAADVAITGLPRHKGGEALITHDPEIAQPARVVGPAEEELRQPQAPTHFIVGDLMDDRGRRTP